LSAASPSASASDSRGISPTVEIAAFATAFTV
jgi:hypothetical protein